MKKKSRKHLKKYSTSLGKCKQKLVWDFVFQLSELPIPIKQITTRVGEHMEKGGYLYNSDVNTNIHIHYGNYLNVSSGH